MAGKAAHTTRSVLMCPCSPFRPRRKINRFSGIKFKIYTDKQLQLPVTWAELTQNLHLCYLKYHIRLFSSLLDQAFLQPEAQWNKFNRSDELYIKAQRFRSYQRPSLLSLWIIIPKNYSRLVWQLEIRYATCIYLTRLTFTCSKRRSLSIISMHVAVTLWLPLTWMCRQIEQLYCCKASPRLPRRLVVCTKAQNGSQSETRIIYLLANCTVTAELHCCSENRIEEATKEPYNDTNGHEKPLLLCKEACAIGGEQSSDVEG